MSYENAYYTGEVPSCDELLSAPSSSQEKKPTDSLKKEISQKISHITSSSSIDLDWGTINAGLNGSCPW